MEWEASFGVIVDYEAAADEIGTQCCQRKRREEEREKVKTQLTDGAHREPVAREADYKRTFVSSIRSIRK